MTRFLIVCIIAIYSNVAVAQSSVLKKDSILKQMKKVAAWQIKEFAEGNVKIPKTNWENGALYAGMMALKNVDDDKSYYDFLYGIGESNRWDMGRNRLFADDQRYYETVVFHLVYKVLLAKRNDARWLVHAH